MSRRPGWEKALYRGIPAGCRVGGAASWRNVSTVIIAKATEDLQIPLTRRRVWFRLFSALAAARSFSRGIGTTYRSFATGVAATQLRGRTHRSRWLFEQHPALRRCRRPRRGDLGLGHSGRRCGDGPYDQDTAEHRAVFRRSIPYVDALQMATRRRQL